MFLFKTVKDLRFYLANTSKKKLKIGFVPTMGAIHDGHLSLIKKSVKNNQITVCSIFVNPTQFDESRDLDKYPRMEDQDAYKLMLAGCNVVFLPTVKEIYPGNSIKQQIVLDLKGVDKVLEGAYRNGHYDGVMQVVKRLLDIVEPDNIYMGQKDYQQYLIIEMMAKHFKMKTKVVCCDIIREDDGLAMSSRNLRLPAAHRKLAPDIYKNLTRVKKAFNKKNVLAVKEQCINDLSNNFDIDYFDIVDAKTLEPIVNWNDAKSILAITAVRIGELRLIDNMFITGN